MTNYLLKTFLTIYILGSNEAVAFSTRFKYEKPAVKEKNTSSYDSSNVASKGVVSSLTNLVNTFSRKKSSMDADTPQKDSPRSPEELLKRIREDYTRKNYLWTGNIDLTAFDNECTFTDPTLSFTGTDVFVRNIQNLRPIVDALVPPGECSSVLLDIQLNKKEGYVKTRWNMVGNLQRLPWKPRIDVIGRTKFWYQKDFDRKFRVVFYDEEWEIPAAKALLQLLTPPGTIPNTSIEN
jgi:hypothetical protein